MIKDLIPWKKSSVDVSANDIFSEFQNHIDKFFDNMCSVKNSDLLPGLGSKFGAFSPKFDVVENDESYEIKAELPGLSKKDIDVSLVDNILTIKGEKKEEVKEKKDNYHVSERRFGKFERSFKLSEGAKFDEIKANFKNGELLITLPKSEEEKKSVRKIEVSS